MKYLALTLLATLVFAAVMFTAPTGQAQADITPEPLGGHTPSAKATPTPVPAGVKLPLTADLSRDKDGKKTTTSFTTADKTFFLAYKDLTAVKGDKVRVDWYAVDTHGIFPKGKKLHEYDQVMPGPGVVAASSLSAPAAGFPPGEYRADLYDGTKLVKSFPFTVTK